MALGEITQIAETDALQRNVTVNEGQGIDQSGQFLLSPELDALLLPSLRPIHISAWHEHVSFGHWGVQALRPRIIVELGTHNGVSFASFCAAVRHYELPTRCFAVDTWEGDAHAGQYDEDVYLNLLQFVEGNFGSFATLMRCLFDEALERFANGSIDLLHIDGLHTYDAVKHDFESWLPKMSERGVIFFHDTDISSADFGVWKLWEEISPRYPHFKFTHSAGLGVLVVGPSQPRSILSLCAATNGEISAIQEKLQRLSRFALRNGTEELNIKIQATISLLGRNLALGCYATQSSSESGHYPTPLGAVNGVKTGKYGFHTRLEKDPWWQLDFGERRVFDHIVLYNRLDGPCKPRARTLRVMISYDEETWTQLYSHDGTPFGGIDGFPLHIRCAGAEARFIRLQLNETNYLHLDQVEIYGPKGG
jgi:hypothetical protein